jgi:hypothetical protein
MVSSSIGKAMVLAFICMGGAIVAGMATLMPWLVVEFERPHAPLLVDSIDMWHLDIYNGPLLRQVSPLWVTAGAVLLLVAAGALLVLRGRKWEELVVLMLVALATGCITFGALRPTIVSGPLGPGVTEALGDGYWVCVASATAAGMVTIRLLLHWVLSGPLARRSRL